MKVRGSYRIAPVEIERARIAVLGEGLGEVIEAPIRAGAGTPGSTDMTGRDRSAADTVSAAGAAPGTPAISPAARSQLEAIRDEWLRPLVERNEELARENGRLQERIVGVERERDALASEIERLRAAPHASPAASASEHGADRGRVDLGADSWWKRLRKRFLGT